MKKTILSTLLLSSIAFLAFIAEINSLEIGKALPKGDVKMQDVSGKTISLNESKKANGLLVVFACNTCPFVIKNETRIKEVMEHAGSNKVGTIVLNSNEAKREGDDSFDAMKKYKESKAFAAYYVLDKNSELADAFGASHTPECFLFDKKGILVYKGAIDDSPADAANVKQHFLKDAVNSLVKGEAIKVSSSKSVGCSIKRKGA